jgi:hypothetical protein
MINTIVMEFSRKAAIVGAKQFIRISNACALLQMSFAGDAFWSLPIASPFRGGRSILQTATAVAGKLQNWTRNDLLELFGMLRPYHMAQQS